MDSLNNYLPEVCKTCIIRAACTKNQPDNTLCQEAHNELRNIIFSFNKKKSISKFVDISDQFI